MTLFLSLFLSTFVLEDVAIASALSLISLGKLSFSEAFIICSSGIAIGDIALYLVGRFASQLPYVQKKLASIESNAFLSSVKKSKTFDYAIVISRAIPGTRIPTYISAGVIKYSFFKFTFLTIFSVAFWVLLTLYFGNIFFSLFNSYWPLALISFLAAFWICKKIITLSQDKWALRASLHFWRKWINFEFWPAWFFYLPIVPYYSYLSLKYKSLLIPFYASPHFKHGGLIGESKWDFLKHLSPNSSFVLPSFVIDRSLANSQILKELNASGIHFPFVLKPDVGQRGFGVRIVKNEYELFEYLKFSHGDVIAQRKSSFAREAGVFYIKDPATQKRFLFSITDKEFPFVIGDGKRVLGDLILDDHRARVIAPVYFDRHKDSLDRIIEHSEIFVLSECGNHCQGALFFDGKHLATQELLDSVDDLVSKVPDFYFGRVDIRYKDQESLKRGADFEVIEINGAGSEATHIWDPNTRLIDAYRTLYRQWLWLFKIGYAMKIQGSHSKPKPFLFIKDCLKVYFRKGPLKTSS